MLVFEHTTYPEHADNTKLAAASASIKVTEIIF